jgi:hypothetical protein
LDILTIRHRIAEGASARGWPDFERMLLRMVDEVHYDAQISDDTWQVLRARYSLEQAIDALYTAAQYQLVSMVLNFAMASYQTSTERRSITRTFTDRVGASAAICKTTRICRREPANSLFSVLHG